jgi:PleD family two-component response regulator
VIDFLESTVGAQVCPIRILHLEDNSIDAEYIESVLQSSGLQCHFMRVEERGAFLAALEDGRPDVVLSDFTLPAFDGLTALQLTRERSSDLPFVFVSGSIGEEFAVECLKQGANDYLLKDKLVRLASAVSRAMEEARIKKEKRRVEERILHNALHDELTGLTNRVFLLQKLQEVVDTQAVDSRFPPILVIVGIDDFKTVCDGFGWEVGDALLQTLASASALQLAG